MSAMASTQAQAIGLVGLDLNNSLVLFDSTNTSSTTVVPVSGPRFIGIDYRPSNNTLYGLAFDGTTDRIYTINPNTGASTPGAALSVPINASAISTGFDFNPVNDTAGLASLRVVNAANQNFAVNVDTGVVTPQGTLAYSNVQDPSFGRDPGITAAAYANNFFGSPAPAQLFDIDSVADTLVRQNAVAGTLTTIGSLGFDFSSEGGFDISTVPATIGGVNTAFAVSNDAASGAPSLYTVNLGTGQASFVGAITSPGGRLTSVSAVPVPYEFPASLSLLAFGGFSVLKRKLKQQKPVTLHTN